MSGTTLDQKDFITESCTQMLLQLHDIYDPDKVSDPSNSDIIVPSRNTYGIPTSFSSILQIKVKVKVICGSQSGVVAAEARRVQTRWVVLDK